MRGKAWAKLRWQDGAVKLGVLEDDDADGPLDAHGAKAVFKWAVPRIVNQVQMLDGGGVLDHEGVAAVVAAGEENCATGGAGWPGARRWALRWVAWLRTRGARQRVARRRSRGFTGKRRAFLSSRNMGGTLRPPRNHRREAWAMGEAD